MKETTENPLDLIRFVYAELWKLKPCEWRSRHQEVYCRLLRFITEATGEDEEKIFCENERAGIEAWRSKD